MITINIAYIIAMMGIPTAITALLVRRLERRQEERDKSQKKKDVLVIKAINASLALGEATAIALKNGKTNGETTAALEYSKDVKHDLKNFLVEQGVEHLH